jgi:hypothetical protein
MMIRTESDDNRLPAQRTEKGIAYERFLQKAKCLASDPAHAADYAQANAEISNLKLSPGAVHFDQVLTSMSVMYQNDEYIGERCMPVVMTNGSLGGQYFEYDRRDRLAYPDDEINAKGTVNELGQNRIRSSYALTPRSLMERIDEFTIQNQSAPLNELMDAQAHVLDGLAFNREVRVAAIVGGSSNYSGNTVTLAASDRWDTATGGDPGGVIDTAKAAVWSGMGPGRWVLAMSLSVYNALKRNPKILDAYKYGGSGQGPAFATRERLAQFFEVDEVLVGRARKDTANIAAASASYSRIWPDVCALIRVSTAPTLRNADFGYVLQDMPTVADMWFDRAQGGKGAYITRATHADQEKVIAGPSGYLVTTPIG